MLQNKTVANAIGVRKRDIAQELQEKAYEYYDKLEEIMNDESCSSKLRADIAMNLLDRAGYKAITKKQSIVNVSENVGNIVTIELAQRARKLLNNS